MLIKAIKSKFGVNRLLDVCFCKINTEHEPGTHVWDRTTADAEVEAV